MHRPALPARPTLALALAAACTLALPARADGYVMGAGRWSCGEVIAAVDSGNASRMAQAAGWVLGYWSAATFSRETGFIDIVEQVGGQQIYEKTVVECRKAPAETLLYLVAGLHFYVHPAFYPPHAGLLHRYIYPPFVH